MGKLLVCSLQKSIRRLRLEGKTDDQIARKLGIGTRSVTKYANTIGCKMKRKVTKKLGRPKKNTPQLQRRCANIIKKYPIKNIGEIKKRLKSKIGTGTIRKALRECNAKFSVPMRERFLDERQRTERFEFAEKKLLGDTKWDDVLYVDEKRFSMDGPDGLLKEWNIKGASQKTVFRSKAYRQSVMVWSGISTNYRTSVYFVEETMNSEGYMELLQRAFNECSERQPDRKFLLYQDRAPCHVSKKTMGLISELEISCVDPPGVSPDANPIENCWTALSRLVYKDKPSFHTKDQLKEAILKGWEELEVEKINNLCSSIKRRLLAIYDAKGGCTKY
jgi:hypothetical protein